MRFQASVMMQIEKRMRRTHPSQSAPSPAKRVGAESEEIPRPAQFSALRAGNGAVRGISELVRVVGLEPTRLTA